jgi:YjjI family glycine radical enzyme
MAHIDLTFEIMRARIGFLVEESGFFDHHFLAKEGLIDRHRFTAMFGIYGTAELVNGLLADQDLRYGHDDQANQLAGQILEIIADRVENEPMPYCWNQRAVFHSQSGISTDEDTTAGARVPTGTEPETIEHILAVAPHHELFKGGVSDIFALDETVRANPAAIADVTLGAFEHGMREITFNVENCDLVRITGYMVRLSDIEKWRNEGSRINSTVLGADSVDNWHLLDRTPRVISNELDPRPRQ